MKNIKIPFSIFFLSMGSFMIQAQVGVNTETPLATLHVESSDPENPSPTEGLIIPRVSTLNLTDPKEVGLLVFLDSDDPGTLEVEKGFYWWDGVAWIPFFSMNKLTKDLTVTYANFTNAFREGTNLTTNSTDIRHLALDPSSLIANDASNFSINGNGELVVNKAGKYLITAVVSLKSQSTTAGRDSYEAKILVNSAEPTPNLRTAYGFPSGGDEFNSNSTISGYVSLTAGQRISVQINRYYRDEGTTVTISPNGTMSSLTLTYLGNY